MKPKLIFNTPRDLPANALELATSLSEQAVNASKQDSAPAARRAQTEIGAARQHSAQSARDRSVPASAPFNTVTPWQRGGINE